MCIIDKYIVNGFIKYIDRNLNNYTSSTIIYIVDRGIHVYIYIIGIDIGKMLLNIC